MTTAQNPTSPRDIIDEQTYCGGTIQIQRNGYLVVIHRGQRKGGLISLEEAQAFILNAR